jgi:predicted ATP-dependent endonuclease of OLD family
MADRSRLVKMRIQNIGCIGPEGCEIALDSIICLVGSNNCGKTTILKAYELAVGAANFNHQDDLCKRSKGLPASVEIWVHIPRGTANIAEKWKIEKNSLLLVRSKWEWNPENNYAKVRSTWEPEINAYSTDDKASGLDTVFTSRLPVPFRIGSLEDPEDEHKKLLTLVLQPIAEKLQKHIADEQSELRKAIAQIGTIAQAPVEEEKERLQSLKKDLNQYHNAIFPDLQIDFDIGIGQIEINPIQLLLKNSRLKFQEWEDEVSWSQQGTGSQRALFWTILQVRSRLKTLADLMDKNKRAIAECEKKIKKLQGEADKVKKEETKKGKYAEISELKKEIESLSKANLEKQIVEQNAELALPGYMLLIDEPEIALHPNAIRAASGYLYGLAEDNTWQVMLATHSPLFIDPLHDHTTIIRLDRSSANPSPRIYRTSSVTFSENERENLKMLNRFDQGLAEMFFGQLPLVIEGDTEYSAFETLLNKYPEQFPLSKKPVLVRARGKFTLLLIMKILGEFKVSFAILHDADSPYKKDGSQNGAWKANEQISSLIEGIRKDGIRVVHRVSIPHFEWEHLPVTIDKDGFPEDTDPKDKPWRAFVELRSNPKAEASVLAVLIDLVNPEVEEKPFQGDFMSGLTDQVQNWAKKVCPQDRRFIAT